jgi:hypothetical protein
MPVVRLCCFVDLGMAAEQLQTPGALVRAKSVPGGLHHEYSV